MGDIANPFDRFDVGGGFGPGSGRGKYNKYGQPIGGIGGQGGGQFTGKAVQPSQGGLPQVFVVRRLGLKQISPQGDMGWVAHVENLPAGMQDVPLPFSSAASLEQVVRRLIQLGHIVQIGD